MVGQSYPKTSRASDGIRYTTQVRNTHQNQRRSTARIVLEEELKLEKEQELEHEPSYTRSRPTSGAALHQELSYTRSHPTSEKSDTKYQVDQVPGKSDTTRVESQNFRRRLEFTQEAPDTWVLPNMILQVKPYSRHWQV